MSRMFIVCLVYCVRSEEMDQPPAYEELDLSESNMLLSAPIIQSIQERHLARKLIALEVKYSKHQKRQEKLEQETKWNDANMSFYRICVFILKISMIFILFYLFLYKEIKNINK